MHSSFRNCTAILALSAAALTICQIAPVSADERVTLSAKVLSAKGEAERPVLVVSATNGRPDKIKTTSLAAGLSLIAEVKETAGGYKILHSDLVLKSEGAASKAVEVFAAKVGDGNLSLEDIFLFEIDPRGPTAQNAIALCGTLKGGVKSAAMSLAMLFRVKTGRFDFRWMQANVARPTEEMLNNPDFYADQKTEEIEAPLDVSVRCEGLVESIASAPKAKAEPVQAAAPKAMAATVEKAGVTPVAVKSEDKGKLERAAAPAAVQAAQPASVKTSEAEKFVCDGGMVRRIASETAPGATQLVCLCPGNTSRQQNGDSNFSCERRIGRRS